jgi:carbon storage regulator CsrA
MLVLTRKCREIVVVGGADGLNVLLKVTVLEIENGKVRLGFEAANSIAIHRSEVWERMRDGAGNKT